MPLLQMFSPLMDIVTITKIVALSFKFIHMWKALLLSIKSSKIHKMLVLADCQKHTLQIMRARVRARVCVRARARARARVGVCVCERVGGGMCVRFFIAVLVLLLVELFWLSAYAQD
jgi:hypothetical protein